nr:hypothetical protein [Tanacetum cinerariifolium]
MVAILEKGEYNTDFHPMVDFIAASPLKIKTTNEGTQILATVDGIQRTVSESSLRCNLKLRDEDGISSLPDTELFENSTLMGTYNFSKMIFDGMVKNVHNKISKFLMYLRFLTICLRMSQFGQITHTHQYVVPFHTKKLFTTLQVNSPSFSERIVPIFDTMLVHQGEGSGTPTEPHHTPSPEADPSYHTTSSMPPPSILTAPSSALPTVADEPASLVRDVSEGEACLTESGFIADQDRATIAKSSTLPHDSAPRVTSPAADEGKELARVLTSMDAATILAGGIDVPTGSGSIPTAGPLLLMFPLAVMMFPLLIDAQVARELEEQQEREDKKITEQIARYAEVARIHDEEELQGMIDSLDRTNETIAKYMQEYQDFSLELPLERRIELISDLVKYRENYSKIYKFQSQQRRPWTNKKKKDYYMAVIRKNLGWKVKDFKGMTFEEIKAKFAAIWKQVEDFIPMGSKEEAERLKRKGFNLEQEKEKKQKTSEEVPDKENSPEEIPEEKVKEMIKLVPIEEVYV